MANSMTGARAAAVAAPAAAAAAAAPAVAATAAAAALPPLEAPYLRFRCAPCRVALRMLLARCRLRFHSGLPGPLCARPHRTRLADFDETERPTRLC